MNIELSEREIKIILFGITSTVYPTTLQKEAYELAARIKSLPNDPKAKLG